MSDSNDDSIVVYQAVAARQLHYHDLLWQVPVLGLTAQAFLFTIALDGSSSRPSRAISALLALITALVSMHLMARHRQADVHDSHWLEAYERKHFSEDMIVHGTKFREQRNRSSVGGPLARIPYAFVLWMIALTSFAVSAVIVLVFGVALPILWPA